MYLLAVFMSAIANANNHIIGDAMMIGIRNAILINFFIYPFWFAP